MRERARQSTSARSSSVNNYDPREMAQRLNETFSKAAEDARQEELTRKIEADLTQKLTDKFSKHLADAKASLEKSMKKQLRSKYNRMVDFFKRQRAGSSSTVPPDMSQFEEETDDDDDDDSTETPNLGDDSTHP